jgi:hypothetical protein
MEASDTLIRKSRQLREESQNLLVNNAEMRELMREALLTLYSKREHWYSS